MFHKIILVWDDDFGKQKLGEVSLDSDAQATVFRHDANSTAAIDSQARRRPAIAQPASDDECFLPCSRTLEVLGKFPAGFFKI
jgi:hypothetical protein